MPAPAAIESTDPFDWSVPPRLLVNEEASAQTGELGGEPGSPIPKYDPDALMTPPDGWTVDFDACSVTQATIMAHEWFVDGESVGTTAACEFSHAFPREGTYEVVLRITDEAGDTAEITQQVTVQDWLIVALGDSYASGEGNPIRPARAQSHVAFDAAFEFINSVLADLRAARDQLPGLEDAREAAREAFDQARETRDEALEDLQDAQSDLQDVLTIITNVENDPTVVFWRNEVSRLEGEVAAQEKVVADAQTAYDNCTLGNCAARLLTLTTEQATLAALQTELAAARVSLTAARNAAVVVYSFIASIQNFTELTLARDAREAAFNAAQGAYDTAVTAYDNALEALDDARAAVASLKNTITGLDEALEEARDDAVREYLGNLPVWTETPPTWGSFEPSYEEIAFDGVLPGEATRCHRSMISGQARAALAIEQADPRTSVTLVHLACSGAKIDVGVVGEYEGQSIEPLLATLLDATLDSGYSGIPELPKIPGQIEAAKLSIDGREIDAMVISIGGNDIRFSDMITQCIEGEPCHDPLGQKPSEDFNEAHEEAIEAHCRPATLINFLTGSSLDPGVSFPFSERCSDAYTAAADPPGQAKATFEAAAFDPDTDANLLLEKYKELYDKLVEVLPGLDRSRVYLTEYPDATGDDQGVYCGWTTTLAESDVYAMLPGVTRPEMTWADMTVATFLRDTMKDTTGLAHHDWQFISATGDGDETIGSATRRHGYCADDNWTIRLAESLVIQQQIFGAAHPDRQGQDVYQKAITNALLADFYPDGVDGSSREPGDPNGGSASASASSGGSGIGSQGWLTLMVLAAGVLVRRVARGSATRR